MGNQGSRCARAPLTRKENRNITRSRSLHLHETETECRGRRSCRFELNRSEKVHAVRDGPASQQIPGVRSSSTASDLPIMRPEVTPVHPRSPETAPLFASQGPSPQGIVRRGYPYSTSSPSRNCPQCFRDKGTAIHRGAAHASLVPLQKHSNCFLLLGKASYG